MQMLESVPTRDASAPQARRNGLPDDKAQPAEDPHAGAVRGVVLCRALGPASPTRPWILASRLFLEG